MAETRGLLPRNLRFNAHVSLPQEPQPSLAGDRHTRNCDANFRHMCRFRCAADPARGVGGNDVDR